MALEIEYSDGYGVTHPEAYARVQKVIIENKRGVKNVCTEVCVYASGKAFSDGMAPVWGPQAYQVEQPAAVQPEGEAVVMECAVDPDTVTVADTYVWLKTQESFKDSKDV